MPFFNFRQASSTTASAAGAGLSESMETIRRRAKHRLIGAAVLVLVGVVGFPLLFDTQPRPIAVDIPIEIPGKNAVKPLVMPVNPEAAKDIATPAQDKVATASSLGAKEEIVTDKKAAAAAPVASASKKDAEPVVKPEVNVVPKPEPKVEAKPEPKPVPKADDGTRAKALLDGQVAGVTPAPAEGRMVVQVGAFADAEKAKEVRQKLEKAGLKTYTQVAQTKDGKRIRVRVGPFATKAEADNAASKIKTLDLPAAVLTL
ncbi:MAG: SPOR domain-containing protein [Polaromonas sp.]|nr:SPOR domain-containing protein [Polaromonas sp.]